MGIEMLQWRKGPLSGATRKALVVALNLPAVVSIAGWPLAVLMAGFALDAPGTNLPTLLLVLSLGAYPFPMVPGFIITFIALKKGDYRRALKWTLISYSLPLLALAMWGVIVIFCKGRFNG